MSATTVQPASAVHRTPVSGSTLMIPPAATPAFVIHYSATRTWAATPQGHVIAWAEGHATETVVEVARVAADTLAGWYS